MDTPRTVADEPTDVRTVTGERPDTYQPSKDDQLSPWPVKIRGAAMVCLTVVGVLFALQWAIKFLVPLALGILLAYTLNPVVSALEKIRVPRGAGATLVLAAVLAGLALGVNTLRGEFQSILMDLPEAAQKMMDQVRHTNDGKPSAIEQVQRAADELEKAVPGAQEGTRAAGDGTKHAQAAPPARTRASEWLWAGSVGAIELLAQATMVVFLVFFLLAAGDTFKRKLVKITGPSLANKRITVQILDEIHTSIQSYMFMLLVTNTLLAFLMWLALKWIGLENAGAWAVAAGFLHIIPYFGPLLVTLATGLSAFMQFESLSTALLVAGSSLVIATFVGIFVTTWMTGKIARMNPTAVFIGLLFWGWLWGIWGLLLGIPIVVVIKVVAEHVDDMRPIAELLSE